MKRTATKKPSKRRKARKVAIDGKKVDIHYRRIPDKYDLYGYYAHKQKLIVVDSRLSGKQRKQTELHELLHAIDCILGCRLSHRQIYALEKGLYQAGVKL